MLSAQQRLLQLITSYIITQSGEYICKLLPIELKQESASDLKEKVTTHITTEVEPKGKASAIETTPKSAAGRSDLTKSEVNIVPFV